MCLSYSFEATEFEKLISEARKAGMTPQFVEPRAKTKCGAPWSKHRGGKGAIKYAEL